MRGTRTGRPWRTAAAWCVPILLFLVSRLVFLDRDLPSWDLAMYQPLDEAAYTIPAFNLHHYGTWTHQELAWIPLEGSPMNVLQSAASALTLAFDWSLVGFRVSSVAFALVAFLALVAILRSQVARARADGASLPFAAVAVLVAGVTLLLLDFGFLLGGRVVEATIARVAVIAVLLWLIDRGTFLGPRHDGRRTFVLGALAGLAMTFGYIYSAFLVPGLLLAAAWWAWERGGARAALRHIVIGGLGSLAGLAVYFVLVQLVYGDNPLEWYQRWLAVYRETGRATGVDLGQLWELLVGNTVRLDRPLMALVIAVLPVYVWWTARSRDRLGASVLLLGLMFVVQSTVQSDYPQRKMLILLPFLVPVAAGGILRVGAWRTWLAEQARGRWLLLAWAAWVAGAAMLAVLLAVPKGVLDWSVLVRLADMPKVREFVYTGPGGRAVLAGAIVGVPALLALLAAWNRPRVARPAAIVLVLAMAGPLLVMDVRHVYTNVTTTYRDTLVAEASRIDGQVTAGGSSYAVQLSNTSRAVLAGAVSAAGWGWGDSYEDATSAYDTWVQRYFAEGRASFMYAYAGEDGLARWTPLGFRLVETLPIILPNDRTMGVWVYSPPAAAVP